MGGNIFGKSIPISALINISKGGVVFADSPETLTTDSNIFWDNINKLLGIGVVSSGIPLEVKSKTTGSAAIRTINTLGNKNADIGSIGSDNGALRLFLSDGTTERIRFNSNANSFILVGNLGLGTSSPDDFLHIKGPLGGKGIHVDSSAGAAISIDRGTTSNGCGVSYQTAGVSEFITGFIGGQGGVSDFSIFDNTAGLTRFHIKSSNGHIGIGTVTPGASVLLHLESTIAALLLTRMTTAQRDALAAVDGMLIYNTSTTAFNFRENGAWVTK